MLIPWMFAAIIADAGGGQVFQSGQLDRATQAMVVPLSGATMTCTKEGDHLVCVVPLEKESARQLEPQPVIPHKTAPYPPSRPALAVPLTVPGPEALAQLKAAEANIELAKSLLPKATTPEESVLAQQLLYRAKEQYRTARALLHTVRGDLRLAPDPFDNGADAIVLCQGEADVAADCDADSR